MRWKNDLNLKEIDKSWNNSSSKYDNFIFLDDVNTEPTESATRDFWNLIIKTYLKKSRPANSPCLTWRYTRFDSLCHPDRSIKSLRLWQILPVKAPHCKYFAILLITLCCMNIYSRKNNWFPQQSSGNKKIAPVSTNGWSTKCYVFFKESSKNIRQKTYNNKHKSLT